MKSYEAIAICREVCPFKVGEIKAESENNLNWNIDIKKLNDNVKEIKFNGQLYFEAKHKKNESIFSSTSGEFAALEDYILKKQGSIYIYGVDSMKILLLSTCRQLIN